MAEAQSLTYIAPTSSSNSQEWHADIENGFCVRNRDGTMPLYADLYNANVYPRYGYPRLAGTSAQASIRFQAPASGSYLVSFSAYYGGTLTSGGSVIADWPNQSGWSDYVTTVNMTQGGTYYFYYKPHSTAYLKGITIAQVVW